MSVPEVKLWLAAGLMSQLCFVLVPVVVLAVMVAAAERERVE